MTGDNNLGRYAARHDPNELVSEQWAIIDRHSTAESEIARASDVECAARYVKALNDVDRIRIRGSRV
jgi:hypothetical protein